MGVVDAAKRATAPMRKFFNTRFNDLNLRLEGLEHRAENIERVNREMIDEMKRQIEDLHEMQRAMLDSLTYIGAAVAKSAAAADTELVDSSK